LSFFHGHPAPHTLHSFPTRRSSDLAKQLMDKELLAMADDITRHPEVGHKEERSVGILTDWLKAHDFDVETGVAGLKTAFVARYRDRKSTRLNSSHDQISYAVFCLKK